MARTSLFDSARSPRLLALALLLPAALCAQSIQPSSLPDAEIGEPINVEGYVLQVVPDSCSTRTWTVSSGALPPGITLTQLSQGSLTAYLYGTPTQIGTYQFTISANPGPSCGSPPPVPPITQSYTYTVAPLTLYPDYLSDGAVGAAYEAPSFHAGSAQTCFTFAVTSGTLPPGLTLTSQGYSGSLSGIPTAEGVYTFAITGTEGNCSQAFSPPRTTSRSYTVRILGISTSSLPQGTVGRPYPASQLQIAGNTGVVDFAGSGLAPNLQVSNTGLITGTTTQAGTFTATFSVFDPNTYFSAYRDIPIIVNGLPTLPPATLPGGTVGQTYSAAVAATGGTSPFTYTAGTGSAMPPGLGISPAGAITGTPTQAGTFSFPVDATDANGAVATQTFQIIVAPAPVLTINPSTLSVGIVGQPYNYGLSASGFYTTPLFSVSAGSLPSGVSLDSAGVFHGTPTTAGLFSFTVLASSTNPPQSTTRDYQVQVVNALSFVTPMVLPAAQAGIPYHVNFQATGGVPPYYFDAESFNIPGLQFNAGANGNVDGTPTTAGTYTFDAYVYDNTENSVLRTFSVTIAPPASITTVYLPPAFVGTAYSTTLASSGFILPPTWSLVETPLPDGLHLNADTGAITGTPTTQGTYPLSVRATSGNQYASKTITLNVGVPGLDFSPDTLPAGTVGVPYSQNFTPSGGVGNYVFSLVSGTPPPPLVIGADGSVTGTPTQSGTFKFVVRLTSDIQVIERLITLYVDTTVLDVTPSSLPDGYVGQDYNQVLIPSGGTAPFTFHVSAGSLPPSVSLDSSTGAITGKPSTAGLYSFDLLLTDVNHKQLLRSYSITVHNGVVLPGSALPDGTEGEVYPGAQIKPVGGSGPFQFMVSAGSLPPGLTMASDGSISGTPLAGGDYSFDVTVTDANNQGSVGTYSIRVFGALVIQPDTLPDGLVLRDYTATLSVTGGAPAYIFELVSGSLPDGILFNAGNFRGAPTAAGTFEFDIKVTDSRQRTGTKHYSITVGGGPSINIQGVPPPGVLGVAYQANFTTSGGAQPFRWSFTGSLPPGLSMDANTGAITGIPIGAGVFPFTVRIDDANNQSATAGFSITIALAPLPPITFNPVAPSVSAGSQVTVGLTLTNPYPVALDGTLTLTFTPDSGFDDPAVVFASGGRTLNFTIPAGATGANFQVPNSAFQTGTVAGLITITAALNVQGSDVTPTPVPTQQVRVEPSKPVITRVDLNKTTTGFELIVYGFSTPREVSSASVTLTAASGKSLATTTFPFTVSQIFTSYFANSASAPFGSQFRLVLPFTVSDLTAIASASITLTNSVGTSTPYSVAF